MSEKEASVRRVGCPSCGGQLRYDIKTRKLLCTQCGSAHPMPEPQSANGPEETVEVSAFRCPQCGAEIVSGSTEATSFCSYCGSDVVLQQRLTRMQRPSGIVPFKVTREQCEEIYRKHLKGHFMAPGELRRQNVIDHFRPVYVPFWSYHVHAEGPFEVSGTSVENRSTETVYTKMKLQVDMRMDLREVLYDASRAFEDETAARLEHRMDGVVPFQPEYLSGLYAQIPDADPQIYRGEAAANAYQHVIQELLEINRLSSVEMAETEEKIRLPGEQIEQELVLMPVWLLAHRQGDQVLYVAVNGANGKIVCDIPVSGVRVAATTAATAAVIFAVLWVLPVMRPDWLMIPCTAIALLTQYWICAVMRRLIFRQLRENEPNFADPSGFRGPLQRKLQIDRIRMEKKDKKDSAVRTTMSVLSVLFRIFWKLILYGAIWLIGALAESLSGGTESGRLIAAAALIAGTFATHWRCFRLINDMPQHPIKAFAFWQNTLMLGANVAAILLLLFNLAEDWIYYLCSMMLMGLTIGAMAFLWGQHNRFATRPVPFFEEEDAQ